MGSSKRSTIGRAVPGTMLGFLLSFGLLAAGPATAADWTAVLPPSSVETHLVGAGLKVLVAASGGDVSERDLAAESLIASLRGQPSVKLVLAADGIGDVSELADAEIVAKASTQPIDQVFVVRVFRAAEPDWSAVVTMYNVDGSSIGGFSAATNDPLRSAAKAPSAGMSNAAAAAVASVTGAAGQGNEAAIKDFEERVVWVQSWAAIDQSGSVMSTWSVPIGGRYGTPLTGKKFYDWIGQDELAQQFKRRKAAKTAVALSSLVPIGLGTLYIGTSVQPTLYTDPSCGPRNVTDTAYTSCMSAINGDIKASNTRAAILGGVVAGAGGVGLLVGGALPSHPVPSNERARLADEYNADLRESLGLPDPTASLPRRRAPGQATAALWLTEGGGGATLGYAW